MDEGITFGICTKGDNSPYMKDVIESISKISGLTENNHHVLIDSREFAKLTVKKNDMIGHARFDKICIVHDYFSFKPNWLETTLDCGNDWDVLLCPVRTLEGYRHADWLVHPEWIKALINQQPVRMDYYDLLMSVAPHENGPQFVSGLPYDEKELTHIQYISGGYVLAKTQLIRDVPMNENLDWGQAEDLDWSDRLRAHGIRYDINTNTEMTLLKPGKWHCYQMPDKFVEVLKEQYGTTKSRLQQTSNI